MCVYIYISFKPPPLTPLPTKKEKNIALMSMKLQDGNRACKDGALIHSAEQSPQRAKADLLGHLVPSWITVTTPVQQRCHVQHTSFTSAELISLLGLSTSLPDSVIMRYPENCITFFYPGVSLSWVLNCLFRWRQWGAESLIYHHLVSDLIGEFSSDGTASAWWNCKWPLTSWNWLISSLFFPMSPIIEQ